jgi:hypothetical protein
MRFGVAAHPMAVSLQCEQHSQGREMGVMVMAMMTAVVIVMVAAMMMTVPAVAAAAIPLRLAFIQREILAHTDIEFAHK